MSLFAHHLHGFLEVEILGRPFPDGPTEHALAFAAAGIGVLLMAYGLYAGLRDLLRWRRRGKV